MLQRRGNSVLCLHMGVLICGWWLGYWLVLVVGSWWSVVGGWCLIVGRLLAVSGDGKG